MEENILNRKVYKDIKKYDRQEMERFLRTIYSEGFRDGTNVVNDTDFKIKLIGVLNKTKGIGEKTIAKIMATVKEME